jgi:glycosyltransferase involved in cell wall biosynthesis
MLLTGPTYSIEEHEPLCRLLSQRFAGELWSFGSYEADTMLGRMRLRVIREDSKLRWLNFVRFARAVLQRAYELRRAAPQAIVVTSYEPFKGGLLALRVARILGAPFMCEVNGVYGNPDNLAHVASTPWRALRQLQMRIIGSYVLRHADAIRLLFAKQLERFVTVRPTTVVREFPALAYTERFAPGPEEKIVLAAGFPFMIKGTDVLVSAFRRLAPRLPEWKLVLIGHRIPEELRARKMDDEFIQALPGLHQPELARWVARCSILVLASRSEAMGRILIEAAAAGKCRVATRVGGIPTVIADGQDGILVPKEDVDALARTLEWLMHDAEARRRLGAAAALRARAEFSPARYLGQFEELIRATLSSRARTESKPS